MLEQLAARYGLSQAQERRLAELLAFLREDDRAPTTVREPARAVDVHVGDSLAALELEVVERASAVADIGSGAGFPGVALAIARERMEVVLIESQRRKCEFLEALLARLELDNARVLCRRVEEWGEGRGSRDLVLARALAPQAVVLEYAAPLLREGGALVDWRGARAAEDEAAARMAAGELGMRLREVRLTAPFAGAREHHLHVFVKEGATPERFPRRPGIARKRPLGGLAGGAPSGRGGR